MSQSTTSLNTSLNGIVVAYRMVRNGGLSRVVFFWSTKVTYGHIQTHTHTHTAEPTIGNGENARVALCLKLHYIKIVSKLLKNVFTIHV